MARKRDIPDFDPDLSSMDGLVKSMNDAAPYLTDFSIGEITLGRLRRLAVSMVRNSYYHSFEIPKKSGGTRTITAPGGELKKIQTVLAYILDYIYLVPSPVMGFVSERSVATNAAQHVGRSYVLNIDLKDFFPSIKRHMIAGVLKKYDMDRDVANLILKLCCHTPDDDGEECLPQGAPTSPVLSNIACTCLDIRLGGLAQSTGLTYTRYADDITFSSDHNVYREDGPFWFKLRNIIAECGFTINEKKTRLLRPWDRQEVTGVTVNSKVNVSRKYLKNLRAELHQMQYRDVSTEDWIRVLGKVNYVRMVRRHPRESGDDYRSACLAAYAEAIRQKVLSGKLPDAVIMAGRCPIDKLIDHKSIKRELAGVIASFLKRYLQQLRSFPYYPIDSPIKFTKHNEVQEWQDMVEKAARAFDNFNGLMYEDEDGKVEPSDEMKEALDIFARIFPYLDTDWTAEVCLKSLFNIKKTDSMDSTYDSEYRFY